MRRISLILFTIVMVPRAASAVELECGNAEEGVIQIDGLLDDWKDVQGASRNGGDGKGDAALTIRCNHDDLTMWLDVEVADDGIVRSGKKQDQVVLQIGKDRIEVWPSDHEGAKRKALWNGKAMKGVTIVDAQQQDGFAIELAIPLKKLRSAGHGVTTFPFTAEFRDADEAGSREWHAIVGMGEGHLTFSEGSAVYQQVLEDLKIRPKDIYLDTMANMDGDAGDERVIAAGRTLVVLSDRYYYMTFPAAKAKDIAEVKILDFAGEGKSAVFARWTEYGGGGSRELIAVWNLRNDGSFPLLWAHEIGKQAGKNRITNAWELAPKKKGKKKLPGLDIVVKVGEAVGWTEETWSESPAEDAQPILLPWGEKKLERWHFRGDETYGGGAD